MATVWWVHVATFETLVAHESMFYIVRMVVEFTSIIDTYRAIQTRCRSSVSYSACVIVSVMHSWVCCPKPLNVESICSKTCLTHNAWLSHSQSSMDTCRVAHTCHALSIHQPITNDVMQHEVTSNIHTSHTEIRLKFHSLLLRSDVTDIHSMQWYLLGSLSINTRLDTLERDSVWMVNRLRRESLNDTLERKTSVWACR